VSTNLPIARRTSPGCCRRHACRAAADSIVVEMLSPRSQEPGPDFNARAQGREAAKQITDDKFSIPNSQYPCAIHRTCPFAIKSFLLRYLRLLLFKVLAASPPAPLLLGALALSTFALKFPGPNLQLAHLNNSLYSHFFQLYFQIIATGPPRLTHCAKAACNHNDRPAISKPYQF